MACPRGGSFWQLPAGNCLVSQISGLVNRGVTVVPQKNELEDIQKKGDKVVVIVIIQRIELLHKTD